MTQPTHQIPSPASGVRGKLSVAVEGAVADDEQVLTVLWRLFHGYISAQALGSPPRVVV